MVMETNLREVEEVIEEEASNPEVAAVEVIVEVELVDIRIMSISNLHKNLHKPLNNMSRKNKKKEVNNLSKEVEVEEVIKEEAEVEEKE